MTRSVFRYVRWRLVTVPPSPEGLVSHRHITGRDLSNLVVLCAREPGHDPRDGHLGAVLDHGTHYWS
ncbi:hypothetical protein [Streptomyces uncialis]|uniref:hypothetical protein n=1 Tax=Streptomyces uncialis TaxID=1048205 RepID=UPI0033DC3648